ncbi:hypothetical protein AB0M34_09160 [Nocardia sp. NPDC050193]
MAESLSASALWKEKPASRAHPPARSDSRHLLELRHLVVLSCLAEAGPLDQRALINRLQVDKSSMVYPIPRTRLATE